MRVRELARGLEVQEALGELDRPRPAAGRGARGGGASALPLGLRQVDPGPVQHRPKTTGPAHAGHRREAKLLLGRLHRDRQGRRPPIPGTGVAGRCGSRDGGARRSRSGRRRRCARLERALPLRGRPRGTAIQAGSTFDNRLIDDPGAGVRDGAEGDGKRRAGGGPGAAARAAVVLHGPRNRAGAGLDAPETTHRDRKRLLACLVEEATLQVAEDGRTEVVIHWRGGRADAFSVKRGSGGRSAGATTSTGRACSPPGPVLSRRPGCRDPQRPGAAVGAGTVVLGIAGGVAPPSPRRARVQEAGGGREEDGELLSVRRRHGSSGLRIPRSIAGSMPALPGVRPDVPGAPLRVRMGADFRSRFRLDPPEGFVAPGGGAAPGVFETVWQRVASGSWNPAT